MAYSPYKDIFNIYKKKEAWQKEDDNENTLRKTYDELEKMKSVGPFKTEKRSLKDTVNKTPYNSGYTSHGAFENTQTWKDSIKRKDAIHQQAVPYYSNLRNNGYESAANEMDAANYEQAKPIVDRYGKMGKNAIRPYFYNLGKKYDMSPEEIDKLLSFDEATGEVTFGGKNMGEPYSIVDGTSYWDNDVLDNAFNDYIQRSGTTPSADSMYNQGTARTYQERINNWDRMDKNDEMYRDYNKQLLDYQNKGVTGSDDYRTAFNNIMSKYNLDAMQGRDNTLAGGAATNSGNIDSYAAANALRQQAAITAQGQQIAHQIGLDTYNARINGIRDTLEKMGVQFNRDNADRVNAMQSGIQANQQIFDNSETVKNNDTARKQVMSQVSGYVPQEWTYGNNPFLNKDCTVKNENTDYQAIIDTAEAKLKNTTDEKSRSNLLYTIKCATEARNAKIQSNPQKYAEYFQTMMATAPEETAEMRNNEADRANSRWITKYQTDSSERQNADDNETTKYGIDKTLEGTKYETDSAERQSAAALDAEAAADDKDYAFKREMLQDTSGSSSSSGGSGDGSANTVKGKEVKPGSKGSVTTGKKDKKETDNSADASSSAKTYTISEFKKESKNLFDSNGKYIGGKGNYANLIAKVKNSKLTDSQKLKILDEAGVSAGAMDLLWASK